MTNSIAPANATQKKELDFKYLKISEWRLLYIFLSGKVIVKL